MTDEFQPFTTPRPELPAFEDPRCPRCGAEISRDALATAMWGPPDTDPAAPRIYFRYGVSYRRDHRFDAQRPWIELACTNCGSELRIENPTVRRARVLTISAALGAVAAGISGWLWAGELLR